jgi:hypothetical protein
MPHFIRMSWNDLFLPSQKISVRYYNPSPPLDVSRVCGLNLSLTHRPIRGFYSSMMVFGLDGNYLS